MKKKFVKETFSQSIIWLVISQVIVKILGLVYKLYLTNKNGFGDEGNAIFSAGFQIYMLVLSMFAMGIPTTVSKIVAEKTSIGDNRGAYNTFKASLVIFSSIGIVASYILLYYSKDIANDFLNMQEAKLTIMMLSPSIFLVSVISVFKGYFAGRQNLKSTAKAQSIDQLVKTITVILLIESYILVNKKTDTAVFSACAAFSTTLANIAELIYMYVFYKKNLSEINEEISSTVNHKVIRKIELIKEIIKITIPIQMTSLISSVAKNLDSTSIVGGLQSKIGYEEAKKQYGILSGKVESLINFPLSFNMSIATALLPRIASCKNNKEECEKKVNQALLCANIVAIPTTICFILFSKQILSLLFPNAPSGGEILVISSISIIFITIEQITGQVLQGIGKTNISIISMLIGVIMKAIMNKILVPNIELSFGGTRGAAIATLACHIIVCTIEMISVIKITKIKIKKETIIKPILGSIIFFISCNSLYNFMKNIINFKMNLLNSVLISSLFYIIYLYKSKILKTSKCSKIKTYRAQNKVNP